MEASTEAGRFADEPMKGLLAGAGAAMDMR
jgi:hypothetical protein